MTDSATAGTELALLRGEVMTALARIEGDVRLVLQSQQQANARVDEIAAEQRRQDGRMDAVERTAVTHEQLKAAVEDARKDVAELRGELDKERTERRADRRVYLNSALALLVLVVGAALLAALNLQK